MDGSKQHKRTAFFVGLSVLVVIGGLLLVLGIARQQPAPPRAVDKNGPAVGAPVTPGAKATDGAPTPQDDGSTPPVLPPSEPTRITIPALKVSSALEKLGLDQHHAMATPRDPAQAGWYTPGPTPGAKGPSVIAGHVTWNGVPAVFFRLSQLDPGDHVQVARRDGSTAIFTVDRVAVYAKDHFPTIEVYRNIDGAGLRLITCGGTYTKSDHHYADNVVVFASLTSSHG